MPLHIILLADSPLIVEHSQALVVRMTNISAPRSYPQITREGGGPARLAIIHAYTMSKLD